MNDEHAHTVWAAVQEAGCRRLALDPNHFTTLLTIASHALARQDGPADPVAADEVEAVVALSWLGPARSFPPADLRRRLLRHWRQLKPAPPYAGVSLAVAFGCGWGRTVVAPGGDWPGRWDRAILELRRLIERFVLDAGRQCVDLGVRFPYEPDAGADADLLVIRLCQPLGPLQARQGSALLLTCTDSATELATTAAGPTERLPPGAKAVYAYPDDHARAGEAQRSGGRIEPLALPAAATLRVISMDWATRLTISAPSGETTVKLAVGDGARLPDAARLTVWECTCGHHRCAERHRLSAWDPALLSLSNFVASAIKGPGARLRTGTFMQGMLYALWAREGF